MNIRARKQRLISEINITPFTDVVLVLLIIFMVTTPLILQSSIKVNLPNAASARVAKSASQINIIINNKDVIYLDDKAVTKKELREKVSIMYRNNAELQVILLSDKFVLFKNVVAVLDILNGIGIRRLNIATKTDER